jgi:hypothetical protein
MFMRRTIIFVGKSIRKYFMGKPGAFYGFFYVWGRIWNYKNFYQSYHHISNTRFINIKNMVTYTTTHH